MQKLVVRAYALSIDGFSSAQGQIFVFIRRRTTLIGRKGSPSLLQSKPALRLSAIASMRKTSAQTNFRRKHSSVLASIFLDEPNMGDRL